VIVPSAENPAFKEGGFIALSILAHQHFDLFKKKGLSACRSTDRTVVLKVDQTSFVNLNPAECRTVFALTMDAPIMLIHNMPLIERGCRVLSIENVIRMHVHSLTVSKIPCLIKPSAIADMLVPFDLATAANLSFIQDGTLKDRVLSDSQVFRLKSISSFTE
jgi:hypothetical protein